MDSLLAFATQLTVSVALFWAVGRAVKGRAERQEWSAAKEKAWQIGAIALCSLPLLFVGKAVQVAIDVARGRTTVSDAAAQALPDLVLLGVLVVVVAPAAYVTYRMALHVDRQDAEAARVREAARDVGRGGRHPTPPPNLSE